ncbi:MAG: glycosyltransferase family 2 protein [Proteobacteria bacterium]|nr:glycosyltransferase family 2 protein [Pseudomonadota bacterium]
MVGHDPLIEVIIPNWNGKDMLEHCLLSLRRQTYTNFRVIVVDNGSSDGSIAMVETSFPEVKLVLLNHNTGFSVAVNRGIEASVAPWLLLLNNDMEVAEDCLEKLRLAVKQYPHFHMVALKMMNYHQRQFIDGAGDAVLRGGVGYRIGTMEQDCEQYRKDRESFGACAGAALYSKKLFDKVGLFDADFFAYLEDVDLNMRARRHGVKCMFVAGAKVYHIGSASSGSKINPLTIRLSTRNNIHVLIKNYPLRLFLRFFPAIIIYQLAWMLFCLKKGMFLPYLAGLYQGLLMLPHFYKKGKVLQLSDDLLHPDIFANMIVTAEREAVTSIMARRTAAGKNNFLLSCYCKFFL